MFVKVLNGAVAQYPYTVGMLRRDNPNTSFPKRLSEATLAAFNAHVVSHDVEPAFDARTQKIVSSDVPVFKGGAWVIEKSVADLTAEEAQELYAAKSSAVRSKRDELLAETDWVVIMHTEKGTNIPLEWEAYRQALRDITAHANFPHLNETDWPVKP